MGLLGNSQVAGDELQRCLVYYEAKSCVAAFQTREADLYNNVLAELPDSNIDAPGAATAVYAAAHRLAQAAKEIVRRCEQIQDVPEAAFSLDWAWRVTSLAYSTWAQATLSAINALANGRTPHRRYVQHLVQEHQRALLRTQEEEEEFLKRLRISDDEIAKIVDRSIEATETESWKPDTPSELDDEDAREELTLWSKPR